MFYCHVEGSGGGNRFAHESYEAAREEAGKLCRKTGRRVYVLGSVAYVEPETPPPPPLRWTEPAEGFPFMAMKEVVEASS